MLKQIILPGLITLCMLTFTACEKNAPEPVNKKMASVASVYSNEFTATGDGYSSALAEIDTAVHVNNMACYGNNFKDSLQIGVAGQAILNGVSKNVYVGITLSYTGLKSYPIGTGTKAYIGIYFIENINGQYSTAKEYTAVSGTVTIEKADVNGYVAGTYSGNFMVDHDPAQIVMITNGKFITPLK